LFAAVQREELGRVQKEMQRTFDLYQQEKIDAEGFDKFYARSTGAKSKLNPPCLALKPKWTS
jgi:hypothetical protein